MLNPISALNARLLMLLSLAVPAAVAVMSMANTATAAPAKPLLQKPTSLNVAQLQPQKIDPDTIGRYSCPACRSGRDPRFDQAINPSDKINPGNIKNQKLNR